MNLSKKINTLLFTQHFNITKSKKVPDIWMASTPDTQNM